MQQYDVVKKNLPTFFLLFLLRNVIIKPSIFVYTVYAGVYLNLGRANIPGTKTQSYFVKTILPYSDNLNMLTAARIG